MLTLKRGSLAYYDSLRGLVPCKVLSVTGNAAESRPSSSHEVKLQVTNDSTNQWGEKSCYRKGEIITCSSIRAVPRKAIAGEFLKWIDGCNGRNNSRLPRDQFEEKLAEMMAKYGLCL